jgi:hypothetical protein
MGKMRLGTYDFDWDPVQYTIPVEGKSFSVVQTYDSVAFFSWGTKIIGKEIVMEWDMVTESQFNSLQTILEADEEVEWSPISGEQSFMVNVCALDGRYIEKSIHNAPYRTDAKLTVVIMSEV